MKLSVSHEAPTINYLQFVLLEHTSWKVPECTKAFDTSHLLNTVGYGTHFRSVENPMPHMSELPIELIP